MRIRNSDQTDHPNLYRDTYWGSFREEVSEDIIRARNQFPDDFGITCHSNSWRFEDAVTGLVGKDHVEVYRAGKKAVIVSSPYDKIPGKGFHYPLNNHVMAGMSRYHGMYHEMASTYIIVLDSIKQATQWGRMLCGVADIVREMGNPAPKGYGWSVYLHGFEAMIKLGTDCFYNPYEPEEKPEFLAYKNGGEHAATFLQSKEAIGIKDWKEGK